MKRLFGINLPEESRMAYALTLIYGVGNARAKVALDQMKISLDAKVKDVDETVLRKLQDVLEAFKVEGDLREEVRQNIKRLREIGSYRGGRHTHGLPVHGQRTKSNGRTKRGKKKTVGSFKKEDLARTQQTAKK